MSGAQLTLGAFNMSQPDGSTRVLADGTSRGNPVPLEVTVKSWLQDGAIVVTQGHDIRELSVRVRFFGSDLNALNALEAALFAELEKPNTLTWTPVTGPASVFVVVTSSLDFDETDDEGEGLPNPWRTYKVRLLCEAFPRSVSEVVAAALPTSGATTTTLDTAGATTGWTGTVNGSGSTVTANVGPPTTVSVSSTAMQAPTVVALQKTFAATTTSTKLLTVDWKPSVPFGTLAVTGDGVALPLVAEQSAPTSGYVRSYFLVAASSLAVTKIEWTSPGLYPATVRTLFVDNVAVTNAPPSFGTQRQQLRSLMLAGSAPTGGSLALESSTTPLGDGTIIYTYPSAPDSFGYVPCIRQFRTSGNTVTSDSTMVSGSREPLTGTGITFTIPLALFPDGVYQLAARMGLPSSAGSGQLTITTSVSLPAGQLGTQVATTRTISLGSSRYDFMVLARLALPPVDLDPQSPATLILNLTATGWSLIPTLDEAWLFNTSIGALSVVNCGTAALVTGIPCKRVWLDPATASTPRPTIRMGNAADRSDSFFPVTSGGGALVAWQVPRFAPPQVNVFAVTPNTTDAVISGRYYPRFHTNASS